MRGKEKPGKTNCGKIVEVRVNLGETGMGRALSLRIPVLFNLRCLMKLTQKKIYTIYYEILTDIKAGRDKFPSLVSTLYRIRKVNHILTSSKKLRQLKCFSRTSLLTIAYITIIFKQEPWEGGKGGSRFRFSLRVGSVNGYVVTKHHMLEFRVQMSSNT